MPTENTMLCAFLVGFWMLAASAQSAEDLKAYYEKQKGEEEKGYLVVLKCKGEILARKAGNKKYLDPEWVL